MILTDGELHEMSPLALAHMGDAVYEVLVRREICRRGRFRVEELHRETVKFVSAGAQAAAARKLLPHLSEAESAVYRRGRNCRSHAAPKAVTEGEYHAATGLEALFGWLYFRDEKERIEELFSVILEDDHAAGCDGTASPAP